MLSRNLEQSLHRALALATEHSHEYATLEHLLLSLTEDPDGVAVLRACGVEVDKLRTDLTDFIVGEMGDLVVSKLLEPKPTAGFQRVVQRAAILVLPLAVGGASLLTSLAGYLYLLVFWTSDLFRSSEQPKKKKTRARDVRKSAGK